MNKLKKTRGKYIVLEGGEGVGKSTQLALLGKALEELDILVESFQEPGGDRVGQALRSILKQNDDDPVYQFLFEGVPQKIHPLTELLMFNAARVQALGAALPQLENGCWQLADRSFISTLAYQGHGGGLDLESVRTVCQIAIQSMQPDLILLLDSPLEVTRQRIKRRGEGTDRIEAAGDEYHQRVHQGYLIEAERLGIPIVQASGTIEEVHQQIWSHVEPLVKEFSA